MSPTVCDCRYTSVRPSFDNASVRPPGIELAVERHHPALMSRLRVHYNQAGRPGEQQTPAVGEPDRTGGIGRDDTVLARLQIENHELGTIVQPA